jgi:hypothetical protein
MERETGIEPATNSLEGCDSTTELLPPSRRDLFAHAALRRVNPRFRPEQTRRVATPIHRSSYPHQRRQEQRSWAWSNRFLSGQPLSEACQPKLAKRAKVGGEGRVRTSVALGRQVYSLLRLTALPPPRICFSAVPPAFTRLARTPVVMSWNRDCSFPAGRSDGAGGGI